MTDEDISGALKTGFPPVFRSDAKLLIVGSFPGELSLTTQRYYAHPRNQFWVLLGRVIGCNLQELGYAVRLEQLLENRIALWDMAASARREGSLDMHLHVNSYADVAGLTAALPELRAIAFNGVKAARLGQGLALLPTMTAIALPSSSPANTASLQSKQVVWDQLARFLI